MGAYVTNLPSTPAMQRYTTAPSAYTSPTVPQSVPNPWGSSLGGCSSCSGMGSLEGAIATLPIVGGITGYYVGKRSVGGAFIGVLAGYIAHELIYAF